MRNRRIGSAVLATTLVIVAGLAVRLMGRPLEQRPQAARVVMTVADRQVMPRDAMPAPPPPAQHGPTIVRSLSLVGVTATADGPAVTVSGGARLYDVIPGNRYVWLLRVYTHPQQKLVWEHHYSANAIPSGGGHSAPEFRDTLALEPGDFRAELTLYAAPPGFHPDGLERGADMKPQVLIRARASSKVTVSDE